jgi:hypothetical protein
MVDAVSAMLAYVQLAKLSQARQQALACHRFLVLTGVSALRSHAVDVAERCRTLLSTRAPRHWYVVADDLRGILKDPEIQPLVAAVERYCSFERAEHLLAGLGLSVPSDLTRDEAARWSLQELDDACWYHPEGLGPDS